MDHHISFTTILPYRLHKITTSSSSVLFSVSPNVSRCFRQLSLYPPTSHVRSPLLAVDLIVTTSLIH